MSISPPYSSLVIAVLKNLQHVFIKLKTFILNIFTAIFISPDLLDLIFALDNTEPSKKPQNCCTNKFKLE